MDDTPSKSFPYKPTDASSQSEVTVKEMSSQTCGPSSVKEAWQDFMEETSTHGCKYILKRRQWIPAASLVWTLLVIVMSGSLTYVLLQLFLSYKEYPLKTVENVRVERSIELPAFTFCLPSKIDMSKMNSSSLLYDYVTKMNDKHQFKSFFANDKQEREYLNRVEEPLSKISLKEFSELTEFKMEDVVIFVADERSYMLDKEMRQWLKSTLHQSKACWTFNWNTSQKTEISYFERKSFLFDVQTRKHPPNILYSSMELYVHDKHRSHLAENMHLLQPGAFTQVYYRKTEHRYLPLPYQSFGQDGCMEVEREDFRNPLKFSPRYSKELCIFENVLNDIVKSCKCCDPFFQEFFPNVSECSIREKDVCVTPKYRNIFLPAGEATDIGCLHECTFSTYDVSLSTAAFDSKSIKYFFPWMLGDDFDKYVSRNLLLVNIQPMGETTRIIEHVPEITLLSIFGTVGGYMGLFLGASLLTLTESLETIIICVWVLISRIKRLAKPALARNTE